MKKIFLICIILSLFSSSFAAHINGYDITIVNELDQNGNKTNNLRFRLKIFGDLTQGTFPATYTVAVFTKAGAFVNNVTLTKLTTNTVLNFTTNNCYPVSNPIGTSLNALIYVSPIINTADYSNPIGYMIKKEECCLNNATNIMNLSNTFLFLKMEFPALNNTSLYANNSSPVFDEKPRYFYCVNKPNMLDWSAVDYDGDQLKYHIGKVEQFDGSTLNYANGFSITNPIGTSKGFSIDSLTGIITFTASLNGRFYIPLRVTEYRNGIKIGEVRRELLIQTDKPCVTDFPPVARLANTENKIVIDTIDVGETGFYNLEFIDEISSNDSLFFTISPDTNSDIDYRNINPFNVSWTELNNQGSPISTQLGVPNFQGASKMKFRFKLIADSNLTANKTLKFNAIVRDIGCSNVFASDTIRFQLFIKQNGSITSQPISISSNKNTDVNMHVKLNDNDATIKWQMKTIAGFSDISNSSKHVISGSIGDTLTIKNIGLQDHAQAYRCIANFTFNNTSDTSDLAYTYIIDTSIVTIYDTTFVTIYDTLTVTDTLIIRLYTNINPSASFNIVKIYPNPASTHITIDAGDISNLQDYTIKIYSSIAQLLYQDKFTRSIHQIDLKTWPGPGTYFVNIYNKNGVVVDSKKIVIQ